MLVSLYLEENEKSFAVAAKLLKGINFAFCSHAQTTLPPKHGKVKVSAESKIAVHGISSNIFMLHIINLYRAKCNTQMC